MNSIRMINPEDIVVGFNFNMPGDNEPISDALITDLILSDLNEGVNESVPVMGDISVASLSKCDISNNRTTQGVFLFILKDIVSGKRIKESAVDRFLGSIHTRIGGDWPVLAEFTIRSCSIIEKGNIPEMMCIPEAR